MDLIGFFSDIIGWISIALYISNIYLNHTFRKTKSTLFKGILSHSRTYIFSQNPQDIETVQLTIQHIQLAPNELK